MNAEGIVKALGGRWSGNSGMARCPAHEDRTPSLSITERTGRLLWHCHAGCSQSEVQTTLANMGLLERSPRADAVPWQPPRKGPDPDSADRARRISEARRKWLIAAPLGDNSAARYLESRGLTPPWPDDLRHFTDLMHGPTGQRFDALVAAVRNPAGEITAVHRTFLLPNGAGKIRHSTAKMALGVISDGGAVRLGPAGPALGLAEGIETALSVMTLFDISCWAALGRRFDDMAIPDAVVEVQIFRDHGDPGIGAAEKAKRKFEAEGRRVFLRPPPDGYPDWNDFLTGRAGQ